jgi:hypothetical protein
VEEVRVVPGGWGGGEVGFIFCEAAFLGALDGAVDIVCFDDELVGFFD